MLRAIPKIKLVAVTALLLLSIGLYVAWHQFGKDRRQPRSNVSYQKLERQVADLTRDGKQKGDREKFKQAERLVRQAMSGDAYSATLEALLAEVQLAGWDRFAIKGFADKPPTTALQRAEKALRLDPQSYRALNVLAFYHELSGRPDLALDADDRLLALNPRDLRAMIHKSRCLLELKRYGEVEVLLGRALKVARASGEDEEVVKVQEFFGILYTRQGKYKKAEEVLRASLKTTLDAPRRMAACPYTALGELYRAMGDHRQEAEYFIKAADWEAEWHQMQWAAARACLAANDLENAHRYIKRALALSNKAIYRALKVKIEAAIKRADAAASSPAAALAVALESFAGNRFAEARRHLERARGGGVEVRRRVLSGFILMLEKKYEQARAQFQQVLEQNPRESGARVGLGHLAIIRKDYKAAKQLLQAADAPGADGAHGPARSICTTRSYCWLVRRMAGLGMGWIASNQNLHVEAIGHFDRILSLHADDVFALLGKGNSQNALSQLKQAEASLGRVLKLDPGNKYAMAELALVKYNRGQDAQAERMFKAALKLDPRRYTCPHEGLGLIYLRAGKLDRAKASFRKAIAINPNIEYRKFNGLARILIREGNHAKARELLRRSIKNYPFDDTARKLLRSIEGK